MCHEKFHVDPDLRKIANTMVGVPDAAGTERPRALEAARLLLAITQCAGLREYLDDHRLRYTEQRYTSLRVKLKSVEARLQQEAYAAAYPGDPNPEDVPF